MKPPKFWIEVTGDEKMELFVGEKSIATFDHDEHGFAATFVAAKMFEQVAAAVGSDFERR